MQKKQIVIRYEFDDVWDILYTVVNLPEYRIHRLIYTKIEDTVKIKIL